MPIVLFTIQLAIVISLAPLVSGLVTKLKNNLRMRQGPSILQPYFNLIKLFAKQEVISEHASWIFRWAPFIIIASSITALALTPLFINCGLRNTTGDLLAILFILALGRFFLTLAGLDTASSFGGMGSSREMFISSLAEPVACLALFGLFLRFGTTNPALLGGIIPPYGATILAAGTLLMVTLAETTRLPIDNQETHLELTMVHEAMVLEYSGKSLALIELASAVKQMVWFLLISHILIPLTPWPLGNSAIMGIGIFLRCLAILAISVFIAVLEVVIAKMRLFRVVDFFAFGFILAVTAIICAITGV